MKYSNLGIDIGSSYLKIWHEDSDLRPIYSKIMHHRGSPKELLLKEIGSMKTQDARVCISGNIEGDGIEKWRYDGTLAEVEYLRSNYELRKLLIMGAQNIELIEIDPKGRIVSYQTNPPCASGTGSFLDEQMKRLGLSMEDISSIPIDEDAPLVATRCAVFAKTDLIHLQQEGYSPQAMYNGLCQGMVISGLKSVFGGRIPDGKGILAAGGLLANPHIRHYLSKRMPFITIAENPAFFRSIALARMAKAKNHNGFDGLVQALTSLKPISFEASDAKPLVLEKSSFPAREMRRDRDSLGNEIWHDLSKGEVLDAFLGVDIGSTSTKAVLVDNSNTIRVDIYTKTSGKPIDATRSIFASIKTLSEKLNIKLNITACGTTGSGRKLIGEIIGADAIINEITAHARGALTLDRNVESIFEIGGQDSKFIRLEQGRIVDVNMNYVCAAGTGSFVEEQADILDMRLDDIGQEVMGIRPLANSDRCTVFMGQEVTRQLKAGQSKKRIMAGVLVSIFKNYLNRVVGNKYYNKQKIVFQGATARNKGLVAALEQLTGARVIVSPFCHVMGAFGVALIAGERTKGKTRFNGLDIPEVKIREVNCRACENNCRITIVNFGGKRMSWGYMCGKEPDSTTTKGKEPNPSFEIRNALLRSYQPKDFNNTQVHLKMPALTLYEEYLPFWNTVGKNLGFDVEVIYPSDGEIKKELGNIGTGDFCYPAKLAMASANVILDKYKDSMVLIPYLIQEQKDPGIRPRSLYCPFVTGMAGIFKSPVYKSRVLTPSIDLTKGLDWQAREIKALLEEIDLRNIPISRIKKAIRDGIMELGKFRMGIVDKARFILDEIRDDERVIVILGRPYNLYHRILNLNIPDLVESLGYKVINMDILPDEVDNKEIVDLYPDMYWYQGQRILKKALAISKKPNLFPLVISNFSCGPDSFMLSYFEEISRNKPYLILEMDEHGSATGYQTRIEAFLDMVEHYRIPEKTSYQIPQLNIMYRLKDIKDNTKIWIPQIHPYTPQLWAATLRRFGYNAFNTGEETGDECMLGKSFCRGSECLPAAVTIGKFLSIAKNSKARDKDEKDILIMPRAEGPCRYGQYATLQSKILDRAGLKNAAIFSPTSEDGYDFLTPKMRKEVWKAICLGDDLFKLRCRTVPYMPDWDEAVAVFDSALDDICSLMEQGLPWEGYIKSFVADLMKKVDYSQPRKPVVGIVGEIFVRMNNFSNQHLVDVIEKSGGEAWLSPMTEWIHYVDRLVATKEGIKSRLFAYIKNHYLHKIEDEIISLFSPVLDDMREPDIHEVIDEARVFIPFEFEGEAILTLGRAKIFSDQGASLVVNCAPFGCMPGRITSYIFQSNTQFMASPVVNLFFDGMGDIVSQVGIYLKSIKDDTIMRKVNNVGVFVH